MGLSAAANVGARHVRNVVCAYRSHHDRKFRRLECRRHALLRRRRHLRPGLQHKVIPGRGLALGMTMTIVAIVVIVPLGALALTLNGITPEAFVKTAFSPGALAAYRLSFGAALLASAIDVVAGGAHGVRTVRYPGGR